MFEFKREVVDLTPHILVEPSIAEDPVFPEGVHILHPQGGGRLRILVLLSRATQQEVARGQYGGSQEYLHIAHELQKQGIDIYTDCWTVGAMPFSGTPSAKVYEGTRPYLYNVVQTLKPLTVIVVGRNAMAGWKGHQFSGSNITVRMPNYEAYKADQEYGMWAGQQIPDAEYAFTLDDGTMMRPIVCPVLNAHDVSIGNEQNRKRKRLDSAVPYGQSRVVESAVKTALQVLADPIKYHEDLMERTYKYHPKNHVVVRTVEDAVKACNELRKETLVAFDYETTGLKPYNKGHRIVMVGLAGRDTAYAIPFFSDPRFLAAYKALMTDPSVRKVAHNAKFEYNWTRRICGYRMENMHWDTMIAAHVLDMRDGVTGLKMQEYLQFGDCGYEKAVKKLLRPSKPGAKKNANDKNWLQYLSPERLDENSEAWDLLLEYVARDAALTYALYYRQQQLFVEKDYAFLMKGMTLLMDTSATVADMEFNGLRYHRDRADASIAEITKRMDDLKTAMWNTTEYAMWKKHVPGKELNLNSPAQMRRFLFEILGYEPISMTKSGNPSTQKEDIEKLNTPFTNLLYEYNSLDKLKGSFLTSYNLEANEDGMLRGFIDLTNVRSYRTSSNSPNMQNCSKRGDNAPYIRKALGPHKGHVLTDMDFSMLEVCINACESKDKALIYYVSEPHADMHRDIGGEAMFYEPQELSKYLRTGAKIFVFRGFYGGGPRGGAYGLWNWMGKDEQKRLKQFGIKNYNDFVKHIYTVTDNMWNKRFVGFTVWKEEMFERYAKEGYLIGLTGFIYDAPDMDARQCGNYPTQGDATHVLLATCNYVVKRLKELGMETVPVSEVHDSMVFSGPESEVPMLLQLASEALNHVYGMYDWLIVPLRIEAELSAVDGNLAEMREYAEITRDGVKILEEE